MTEEKEETKLNIKGQWFYRGNRSPTWVAMASRSDGSASGVAERVPQEVWPILECVASQAAEIARLKADAERYRWLREHDGGEDVVVNWNIGHDWVSVEDLDAAIDSAKG